STTRPGLPDGGKSWDKQPCLFALLPELASYLAGESTWKPDLLHDLGHGRLSDPPLSRQLVGRRDGGRHGRSRRGTSSGLMLPISVTGGSSSYQSSRLVFDQHLTLWWASEISPGAGTPPPTMPASLLVRRAGRPRGQHGLLGRLPAQGRAGLPGPGEAEGQ